MFTKQLSDARASRAIKQATPKCSNTTEFRDLVNESHELLWRRGNWFDSEWLVRLCIYGGCVTWPEYVGTVLGTRFCHGEMDIRNVWQSIIGRKSCSDSFRSNATLVDAGTAPTHTEISGELGKPLRYFVLKAQDIGKTITYYGKEYGGQPLQTWDGTNWSMGFSSVAASPWVQTPMNVSRITAITRQATQGLSYIYEYDTDSDKMIQLAEFQPNETNPRYRRSKITNMCFGNGTCAKQVDALVKLAFIKAVNDNDFLMIDNFDATALAIQAIKHREAKDYVNMEAAILLAVKELNFELRDKSPGRQIAVSVNCMGSGRVVTNMT